MNEEIIEFFQSKLGRSGESELQVTLSYAQSLDGSIALEDGKATSISGPESLKLTHQLRAIHQGILVGIGTILADDPQLSVREVEGNDPQPLILDSHLRFPINAKLLKNNSQPWIFCLESHNISKREKLEAQGANVYVIPPNRSGGIDLKSFLLRSQELGIDSMMLEGGATLIASFLEAQLIYKAMITIAPIFIGGLKVLEKPLFNDEGGFYPRFQSPNVRLLGEDLMVWGKIK